MMPRYADAEDLPHELIEHGERVLYLAIHHERQPVDAARDHASTVSGTGRSAGGPPHCRGEWLPFRASLAELLHAGRCHYLRGWLSEAIRIGPLVPLAECRLKAEWNDEPEKDVDIYRLRVAQQNGQWTWLTPLWVER